jgi:hypothetical protein
MVEGKREVGKSVRTKEGGGEPLGISLAAERRPMEREEDEGNEELAITMGGRERVGSRRGVGVGRKEEELEH